MPWCSWLLRITLAPNIQIGFIVCKNSLKSIVPFPSSSISFHISPNNQYVVSGGGYKDNTVRMWDVESGDCIKTLEGHTFWVSDVSFSPNNQYVVSGSSDRTVRIWNVDTV